MNIIALADAAHLPFASGIAQTCVTSPPYYGLRDYGVDGQIGLEETPEAYITKLVAVFREVRRVLKDDGTLWLNLGDSYVGAASEHKNSGSFGKNSCISKETMRSVPMNGRIARTKNFLNDGLKPKDLLMIPARVALALQADGWYLRSEIIWHKPNPMPESVTDRPTKSHEMIYLLAKSARYFYDAEAVSEPCVCTDPREIKSGLVRGRLYDYDSKERKLRKDAGTRNGGNGSKIKNHSGNSLNNQNGTRNRRDVWTIATSPYSGAHFATFPPKLIDPCILAGSRPGDIVLDPFSGSGTTAEVAVRNGRKIICTELNPEYVALSRARLLATNPPLFTS